MGRALPTVWIQPNRPAQGCGGCISSSEGPACRAHVTGEACAHPLLAGPVDEVQRVMEALNRQVVDDDTGRGIVDLHWVRALRIEGGEAELTLSFAPACGPGKQLSESAFQTLRSMLPDTDVYVRHEA